MTDATFGLNDTSSKTENQGVINMIKKLSIKTMVAGAAVALIFQGGAASASFGDPVPVIEDQFAAKDNLAAAYRNMTVSAGDDNDKSSTRVWNADYTKFIVGPGDPFEETGRPRVEAGGGGKQFALSLASLYRNMTVSAGDDKDKSSTRVWNADYTKFIVGPGDPFEETGRPQVEAGGGGKQFALSLASLYRNMTIGAGDDKDKPSTRVWNADYTKFIVGPGDPFEETGRPQVEAGGGGGGKQFALSLASLYRNMTVGAGDNRDNPSPRVWNAVTQTS